MTLTIMLHLSRVSKEITRLEKEMLKTAKNLEFETATELRDQIKKLRESVLISPLKKIPSPSRIEGIGGEGGCVVIAASHVQKSVRIHRKSA